MAKNELKVKGGKRELDHLRLFKADGGYIAESHMKPSPHKMDEPYEPNEPEAKIFSDSEGDKFLAHVAAVLGVPGAKEELNEGEHNKASKKGE